MGAYFFFLLLLPSNKHTDNVAEIITYDKSIINLYKLRRGAGIISDARRVLRNTTWRFKTTGPRQAVICYVFLNRRPWIPQNIIFYFFVQT